jgi:hypothetical protein
MEWLIAIGIVMYLFQLIIYLCDFHSIETRLVMIIGLIPIVPFLIVFILTFKNKRWI